MSVIYRVTIPCEHMKECVHGQFVEADSEQHACQQVRDLSMCGKSPEALRLKSLSASMIAQACDAAGSPNEYEPVSRYATDFGPAVTYARQDEAGKTTVRKVYVDGYIVGGDVDNIDAIICHVTDGIGNPLNGAADFVSAATQYLTP